MVLEYQVKYTTFLRLWFRYAQSVLDNLPGFRKVAKTYLRWFDIITNYFKYRVANGFTEGMSNKMKVDKWMAYGYRNFSN